MLKLAEDIFKRSLEMHRILKGKLSVDCRRNIESMEDLALVYTPGVGEQ